MAYTKITNDPGFSYSQRKIEKGEGGWELVKGWGDSACIENKSWKSQNSACSIVTHRRDTSLISSFLREVWGGGKGEGNVPSVRASTKPDTTVGTVRFCTLYTKGFSRSKSRLCPF